LNIEELTMKKIFCILTIVLATLSLNPRAAAEGAYFGVRGEGFIPLTNSFGSLLTVPLFGVQVGYDFAAKGDPGFSLRGSLASLIVVNRIGVDALYRIPSDATGTGWYVGAGADLVLLFSSSVGNPFGVHAVAGYTVPLSDAVGFFVEAYPGLLFFGGGSPLVYISLATGINFRL
jgi:hypothetical protein